VNTSAGGMMMERAIKMTDPVAKNRLLDSALVYIHKAVEIHPKSTNAWMVLGRAEIEKGNLPAAADATENCLKVVNSHGEAINNMLYIAQEYDRQKKYSQSSATYKRLIKYQPEAWNIQYELACEYEKNGQNDSTLFVLNEILKKTQNYMPAYRKLGEIFAKKLNNIDKALEYFLKAYQINSVEPTVLENLGVIYGMKKDFPRSVEFFQKAIAVTPENPQLYRNIATSYSSMGQMDKMNEAMAKAAELEKK
jgi:tetratricopeptide (TPR) repeat protein